MVVFLGHRAIQFRVSFSRFLARLTFFLSVFFFLTELKKGKLKRKSEARVMVWLKARFRHSVVFRDFGMTPAHTQGANASNIRQKALRRLRLNNRVASAMGLWYNARG